MAEAALDCNLTLVSDTLIDVRGCYVGQASSSERGLWVEQETQASVSWQVL